MRKEVYVVFVDYERTNPVLLSNQEYWQKKWKEKDEALREVEIDESDVAETEMYVVETLEDAKKVKKTLQKIYEDWPKVYVRKYLVKEYEEEDEEESGWQFENNNWSYFEEEK